eukprot:g926.t1
MSSSEDITQRAFSHRPGAYLPTKQPTNRRSDGAEEQQPGKNIDKQAAEKRLGGKNDRADDPPSDDGSGVDWTDEIAMYDQYMMYHHDDYMKELLCYEKARAFLKGREVGGTARRFCVLDAKTEKVITFTPEWLEATGLAVEDVMKVNASRSGGIRHAVGDARHPAPPELLKFLEKPDDIFVPQKVTLSSSNRYGQRPAGPVLFQNLLAGALPNESRARVVKFPHQWHKKDGRAYTGYTAVSRLFCHNEDGTDVAAYLLELCTTEWLHTRCCW